MEHLTLIRDLTSIYKRVQVSHRIKLDNQYFMEYPTQMPTQLEELQQMERSLDRMLSAFIDEDLFHPEMELSLAAWHALSAFRHSVRDSIRDHKETVERRKDDHLPEWMKDNRI